MRPILRRTVIFKKYYWKRKLNRMGIRLTHLKRSHFFVNWKLLAKLFIDKTSYNFERQRNKVIVRRRGEPNVLCKILTKCHNLFWSKHCNFLGGNKHCSMFSEICNVCFLSPDLLPAKSGYFSHLIKMNLPYFIRC